jgi:hypothetical protein
VSLRNLVIVPLSGSSGAHGIDMQGASSLVVDSVLIAGVPNSGIYVLGTGTLRVTNSVIRNAVDLAVQLEGGAHAEISGTRMLGNGSGGVAALGSSAGQTTVAVVSDCIISGGQVGVLANTPVATGAASVTVTRSTIEGTIYALDSETSGAGSSLVAVSASTIVRNDYAWYLNGAGSAIQSPGTNHVSDNRLAPVGTVTSIAPM